MKPNGRPENFPELLQVVTMAEAARLTYRDPMTIRYAIDAGLIAAVPCGRIWLVSVPSLFNHFTPQKSAKTYKPDCRLHI